MAVYQIVPPEQQRIPAALRVAKRWCAWQQETPHGGKPTKVPDQSTLDLARCRTLDEAAAVAAELNGTGGIGFVTTGRQPVTSGDNTWFRVLVDLDACRHPETGEVSEWAVETIVGLGNGYTEVSPSGTGLRIVLLVRELPAPGSVKALVMVPHPAPEGVLKRPQVQLFGLGPAGYVTITGQRLDGTNEEAVGLPNLDWLIDRFHMRAEKAEEQMAGGEGPEPEISELDATLREWNAPLVDGEWAKVMPGKSASEAYHLLVRRAMQAARGHEDVVVDWLLQHTAWGRGEIDDSRDPAKYARASWVAKEVVRCRQKHPTPRADAMFEPLAPAAEPAEERAAVSETPKPPLNTAVDVAQLWQHEGPLVHLPTGIESLDNATGGGLVLSSRVYLIGAPDSGKTLLGLQIIDHYLQQGITCAMLPIDEEASDIAMRLMQRRGWPREVLESRSPEAIAALREEMSKLPLLLFSPETTIESAAVQLAAFARQRHPGVDRPPCVLLIDSVQTAHAEGEDDDASLYKSVTHRVRQIRAAATRYRMLVIATSEMSRAAYRSKKTEENSSDMAAAKESGAIEFSARLLVALRPVAGVADVVEARIAKNKHGPSTRNDQDGIFLRVDRGGQRLAEDAGFKPLDEEDQQLMLDAEERRTQGAARLCSWLQANGPTGTNASMVGVKESSKSKFIAVRDWLLDIGALTQVPGPNRLMLLQLVPSKIPSAVLAEMAKELL